MKLPAVLCLAAFTAVSAALAQAPDNTGTNARDQNSGYPTSEQQSNAPADVKMTAEIRKMVIADEALSALAKNAKIITIDQVVTLRGPVETEKEVALLETHAKHAGATKVVNLLEVKQP